MTVDELIAKIKARGFKDEEGRPLEECSSFCLLLDFAYAGEPVVQAEEYQLSQKTGWWKNIPTAEEVEAREAGRGA